MRLPVWRSRLTAYCAAHARTPFAEGAHDCAQFAAGAVEAMTGTDPMGEYRGRYTTIAGGMRVLKKAGFADHVEFVASKFAEYQPSERSPRLGDLVAVDTPEGMALGIWQGQGAYVPGLNGLVVATDTKRFFEV